MRSPMTSSSRTSTVPNERRNVIEANRPERSYAQPCERQEQKRAGDIVQDQPAVRGGELQRAEQLPVDGAASAIRARAIAPFATAMNSATVLDSVRLPHRSASRSRAAEVPDPAPTD